MMSIGEDGSLLEQLKDENIEKNQITNVQMKKNVKP